MSRWRPPAEGSTAIITRAGFERLRDELNDLWRVRRPEVVKALGEAAAEGDRSENAEYLYRKKQLGEIDRRVRYLSKRLEALRVVDQAPADRKAIFFGAWFEIEDTDRGADRRRVRRDAADGQGHVRGDRRRVRVTEAVGATSGAMLLTRSRGSIATDLAPTRSGT